VVLSCDGHAFSTTISRDDFRLRTDHLLTRAMDLVEKALKSANVQIDQVKEFLRVGGASQMPCFEDAIEQRFGRKPSCRAEPFYAIALGTLTLGRLAHERAGNQTVVGGKRLPPLEIELRELTSHAVGVCILRDDGELVNSVILRKGVPIPSDHTTAFQLAEGGQTDALIKVLQGPDGAARDACHELGFFELKQLNPVFDKPHQIDVRLRIDRNGVLTAEASDPSGGRREEMTVAYDGARVAEEVAS